MKKINFSITSFLAFCLFLTTGVQAQNEESAATLDEGPIAGQFDYTIEESSKYEDYRVIRTNWMYKLKSNVLDSIQNLQDRIEQQKTQTDSLNQHITELNEELESAVDEMEQAKTSKNSISFFGSEIPKQQYNTIMWAIVIILAAALAAVFFMYKRSILITREIREKHEELEKEFEAHRKRALEKEKTMARQHLNEINKLKGRE